MSYIYDALKRAEDERRQGAVTVRPVGRPLALVARPPWWVWALIGVMGANILLLVTLTVSRGSRSPAATSEPIASVVVAPPRAVRSPVVDTRDAPTPSAPVPQRERPRPAPSPAVAPAPVEPHRPAATDAVRPAAVDPRRPAATDAAATAPVEPRTPAATEQREPAATPPRSSAPTAPRVDRTPAVVPTIPPGRTTVEPPVLTPPAAPAPPGVASAPPAGDGAPRIVLQVLVYSPSPAQRMVFIDGRRYGEGDAIDAETVLERINPDGVVVRHRGQRFTISDRRQ